MKILVCNKKSTELLYLFLRCQNCIRLYSVRGQKRLFTINILRDLYSKVSLNECVSCDISTRYLNINSMKSVCLDSDLKIPLYGFQFKYSDVFINLEKCWLIVIISRA